MMALKTFSNSQGIKELENIYQEDQKHVVANVSFVGRGQSNNDVGNYSTSRLVRAWRILTQVINGCVCVVRRHL